MDGVFLSAQLPSLRELALGARCSAVGVPVRHGLGLEFPQGLLVLCARPDMPSLWWEKNAPMEEHGNHVWADHLVGARLTGIGQPGADRILHLDLDSDLLYGCSSVRLVFEAAGRNSNLILLRRDDGRILACDRKVTSKNSRYRTVVPGSRYRPPPSSGLPPGEWLNSRELGEIAKGSKPKASSIYSLLEGVGPVTARAVIRAAENGDTGLIRVLKRLEKALVDGDFSPWLGPEGPLPIELGPGRPMTDPLAPPAADRATGIREDRLETLQSALRKRLAFHERKLVKIRRALNSLVEADEYRIWGNLLLSQPNSARKGLDELVLKDWNGLEHRIPLKPSRSLRSNAERFFRKASRTSLEEKNLRKREKAASGRIDEIRRSLDKAPELSAEELLNRISQMLQTAEDERSGCRSLQPVPVGDGWRVFVGRNARENEEVTFRIGRKNDIWFHARGIPGAHVVLKMDGRGESPPGDILRRAAVHAARGSGVSSGVIPVDYTRVQYVNRIKKAKTGHVTYTREKTIFVDLEKV